MATHNDTVKGSGAELKQLRSKAKNGLRLASMVLRNSLQSRVSGICVHIFDPTVQDFVKAITKNKTPRSAQHRNVLRTEGEQIQSIIRSVCGPLDMGKPLEDMGFVAIAPGIVLSLPARSREDRRMAQLVTNLFGLR